jgi:hypothetical protein
MVLSALWFATSAVLVATTSRCSQPSRSGPGCCATVATRHEAWVAEVTALLNLSKWPTGTRLALYARDRPGGYFTRKGRISLAYAEDDPTAERSGGLHSV